MTDRLSVEGASVSLDGRSILVGVDLAVGPGRVLALLGPSGSGKSTLLRVVAGLQPLDSGTVRLDGVDQRGVPPHRRGVGLMFQDHALFPHRDVAGNVAFGLRMQGRPAFEIADRVDQLLTLVGLTGFGPRRVDTLSGGERQRVALARALAPNPRVLLLDEPLGSLDQSLRGRLVADLVALFDRLALTVVVVTHDRTEAFAMADQVVLLDRGSVVQAASPTDLWVAPKSRRAAELLGFRNIVEAEVAGGVADTVWGPVAVPAPDGRHWLVIHETGAVVDPAGPADVMVRGATFAGDHTAVTVGVDSGPDLHLLLDGPPPAVGDSIRLRISGAVIGRPER